MAEIKLVINDPKTGKSYSSVSEESVFVGRKIGDKIKDVISLSGYELEITGGSDSAGFPMRRDVSGIARKRIFSIQGIGMRIGKYGKKVRKTVAGNTINDKIKQVNLKIIKEGNKKLDEIFVKKEEKSEGEGVKKEEKKK